MNNIPFSQVRARLAQTLSDVAAAPKPTVISRRGRPCAVLMSVAQYERLGSPRKAFATQLADWRQRHGDILIGDAADPWADARDATEGRAAPW